MPSSCPVRTIVAAIIVIAVSRCGVCSVACNMFRGRPLRCRAHHSTPRRATWGRRHAPPAASRSRVSRGTLRQRAKRCGQLIADAPVRDRPVVSSHRRLNGGVGLRQPSFRQPNRGHAHIARRIVERLDHRIAAAARRARQASTARAAAFAAPSRSRPARVRAATSCGRRARRAAAARCRATIHWDATAGRRAAPP